MENEEELKEPEKKKPHLNSHPLSPAMARNSATSPSNNKSVDAAVLQYQNQKLVQQLDSQKHELHGLEAKIKELKENQTSYDDMLITVNQLWNQLVDDLILLGVRAGGGPTILHKLDSEDQKRGSIPSCPSEDMFLCRVLQVNSIESSGTDGIFQYVDNALASRHSSTKELMKFLEDVIDAQREKTESIAHTLHGKLSAEDAIIQLSKIDDMMKEEAKNLHQVIEILHLKHKEYAHRMETYISSHSVDQAEIQRLAGELEEIMAELEESRRKLVSLKMQKDMASGMHSLVPGAITVNGSVSPEKKPADRTMDLQELKDSIEEVKVLAADRLSELEEARQDNINLSKQLQNLQNELNDDKYVHSSRLYNLVNDQLQHWTVEMERYKALADSLQIDRSLVVRREKEVNVRVESADAARNIIDDSESRIEQLELQLQKCMIEKNDLDLKMEEIIQDSGRKDIKAEFRVMASALSKEMGMMKAQLNRWKETADEALSLHGETESLKVSLSAKTNEQRSLADKCEGQMAEIKSLKALIEKLQKEKVELQIILDMYGQEGYDHRDVMEIKESERRAHSQAEVLQNALDEHSLELRVKAANEAEAACQQRLSAAEAEIAELRAKLDASERDVIELKEAIKSKDQEAEAYISEIETIGQAYEDMQTQNQHLLQQVTERDDHNIKLVSESVKTKQTQSFLLSEKQAAAKQLQQVNALVESLKLRILHSEEQMKVCLTEALKCSPEDRHIAINLETAKWELVDAEKELKWLKSALTSSEKDYEQIQRKMDDIQKELDNERNERKKLEEDLMEVNNKVAELTSETGEAAIQKLQDEIKDCKAILKCGVCFDRPKEVVIVKCYHLFCNPCIQRNLEIRHRKCPGCGTAFGQSDVRFVKI
ncbi:E3 ubiquitin protein ligase [Melia azedarach]|uniref:E3 ubiquitin protein ligase n=1 Tax=Melia azedarach TaxID=155640 RepID=A0ACC1YLQ8_MELAZ|nr:E3 ubiquitin protein ligase [Melia azedarach]